YEVADQHPDFRDAIRMWHDNWIDLATPPIVQSVRCLRALRENGIPVFALTNFGIDTFAIAQARYDFLNEFDREYVSARMRVIKPDAQIYEMVEADCRLDPTTLLFADDRADNINAAAARGWQTHVFDGPQGWADRLVAEGLLTKEQAQ
ncbi:MAG: HAD-IA family hydrolase, partial [Planktomarina sp.]